MSGALHELSRRLWAGELGMRGTMLDALLAPGEAAFRAGVALRDRAYAGGLLPVRRAAVPVISVGNLAVGGTGKTPFAHWLAVKLRRAGRHPAVLHGGYAADEPALHRRWAPEIPVVVERDRTAGAARAVAAGADVLILDDAFQHRRLHRDLDLVLVAAERWSDRRRLLPRGPWREPASALRRADIVVVTRKTASIGTAQGAAAAAGAEAERPTMIVHLDASRWLRAGAAARGEGPPPEPAVLVCGIADPELFAGNADGAGARIAERVVFPDHHDYREEDAHRIRRITAGRPIVTTEKDWTKLQRWLGDAPVWLLAQDITIDAGAGLLDEQLDRVLA